MKNSLPGPDGFTQSPSDRLHAANLLLNEYLTAEEVHDPKRFSPDPTPRRDDQVVTSFCVYEGYGLHSYTSKRMRRRF